MTGRIFDQVIALLVSSVFQLVFASTVGIVITKLLGRWLKKPLIRRTVVFPLIVIVLLYSFRRLSPRWVFWSVPPETRSLVRGHRWISYDPSRYTPEQGRRLDLARVRRDLVAIRAAGFTGIVTYSMQGDFARIPEIASSVGLAVIAGILDPKDRGEISNGIARKKWIVGYCVGHCILDDHRYTLNDIEHAMLVIRVRTGRPVSTTDKLGRYKDARLRNLGDWLFPDSHFSGRDKNGEFNADINRDVKEVLDGARDLVKWNEDDRRLREILLKTVTYPWRGIEGASPEAQRLYFLSLLDRRRDVQSDFPPRVSIAVSTAFDDAWKVGYPFYPWDPYTSLFDENWHPRPAVREIIPRL